MSTGKGFFRLPKEAFPPLRLCRRFWVLLSFYGMPPRALLLSFVSCLIIAFPAMQNRGTALLSLRPLPALRLAAQTRDRIARAGNPPGGIPRRFSKQKKQTFPSIPTKEVGIHPRKMTKITGKTWNISQNIQLCAKKIGIFLCNWSLRKRLIFGTMRISKSACSGRILPALHQGTVPAAAGAVPAYCVCISFR